MAEWESELDRFIAFNERPILRGLGSLSHTGMERIAGERYDEFNAARKAAELEAAEREHADELKKIEREAVASRPKKA